MNLKNICIIFLLNISYANAQNTRQFKSQPQQTTMIELYSSQGCSSCPPAERWISRFVDDDTLWIKTVPLVFHVDYWNDIGWVDIFATSLNSNRQRAYHRQGKVNSVYTPGLIVNGEEWRGGQFSMTEKNPGVLQASLVGQKLNVAFERAENLVLNVSVLGVGIKTEVKSGENEGEIFVEDFIVLSHQKMTSAKGKWQLKLADIKYNNVQRYGLAIWVSYPNMNTPIQSTGGWLPRSLFGS